MWFLVDVDEQKVNWENSVMTCRRVNYIYWQFCLHETVQNHLLSYWNWHLELVCFNVNNQDARYFLSSKWNIFGVDYWWIWCSISIPLWDPIRRLYSAPSSLKESQVSALPSTHQHPCLELQRSACLQNKAVWALTIWKIQHTSGGCTYCNRKSIVATLVQR